MINKATLIGNVGNEPEVKISKTGNKFATFSLATTDYWKDRTTGEKKESTQWHRVVVFNDAIANIVDVYVRKGSKVYVEGQIKYEKYTDKDGLEKYSTKIEINFKGELRLLDKKEPQKDFEAKSNAPDRMNFVPDTISKTLDDEIPF